MEIVNMTRPLKILNTDDFIPQYIQGESILSISNRLGVARKTIALNLTKNGIKLRTQSQAGIINWSKMTPERRQQQVKAAHKATLGRIPTFKECCKSANGRERNLCTVSEIEVEFAQLMKEAGINFAQQTAIGPYNCDFTAETVAIEIFGGNWHWYGDHLARVEKRFRYILYSGWHIICLTGYGGVEIGKPSLHYLASYLDFVRRNPLMTREYRVIRGAGDLLACGGMYDDKISIVPSFTAGEDINGNNIRVTREATPM